MITMVEKWIHRECERDVADLVQPTQNWSGGPCAVCGQIFGVVWLNEVEEEILIEAIEITGELVEEAVSEPSEPIEPEPELEVIAVLEEAESIKETIDVLETIEDGGLSKDLLIDPEADVKAEIARLRAEIEALEK